jgi:hypothetical protein
MLTIPPAQISPNAPPPEGLCMELKLRHVIRGTVDPALAPDSVAESDQTLTFRIRLVP